MVRRGVRAAPTGRTRPPSPRDRSEQGGLPVLPDVDRERVQIPAGERAGGMNGAPFRHEEPTGATVGRGETHRKASGPPTNRTDGSSLQEGLLLGGGRRGRRVTATETTAGQHVNRKPCRSERSISRAGAGVRGGHGRAPLPTGPRRAWGAAGLREAMPQTPRSASTRARCNAVKKTGFLEVHVGASWARGDLLILDRRRASALCRSWRARTGPRRPQPLSEHVEVLVGWRPGRAPCNGRPVAE